MGWVLIYIICCSLRLSLILKFANIFFTIKINVSLKIQVTDTNDNPPIFNEPAYSFDIPENAERGYQVGIISAVDSDLGSNSMISYTVISDWANDVFSLNPQTGVFTLTARLDYEEVNTFWLESFYDKIYFNCTVFFRFNIIFSLCKLKTMVIRVCPLLLPYTAMS